MALRYNFPAKGFRAWIRDLIRAWISDTSRISLWKKTLDEIQKAGGMPEHPSLFTAIEIETRTRCNSSCSFCGASILHDKRPDIRMPDELLDKIFAELGAMQFKGMVRFFGNNEPLLDPRLPELIRKVKAASPECSVEVQTNGLKLNPRIGRELLEAGLDVLFINNYSDEGQLHNGVRAFLKETAHDYPNAEIMVSLRQMTEDLNNRAGTAPNAEALKKPLPLPCMLPFSDLVVTADGRVAICCQDLEFQEVMGNLNAQSLLEVWNGDHFNRIRAGLMKGDRSVSEFCKGCDYRGFKDEFIPARLLFRNRLAGTLLNKS